MSEKTAFEAYQMFIALKQHFSNSNYDFFKYHGKIKASRSGFRIRKDKYFFEKLSRKYSPKELMGFYVSNLIKNPEVWIGEMCRNRDSQQNYLEWKRRKESSTYCFQTEVAYIKEQEEQFDNLFECNRQQHPKLVDLYTEGSIALETLVGIDFIVDCFKGWNKIIGGDLIWKDLYYLCRQYRPFLEYDKRTEKKFRDILRKEFSDV